MADNSGPVQLKPETVQFFEGYVQEAEAGMDKTLDDGTFLWALGDARRVEQVNRGRIPVALWPGRGPVKASSGLIHDWIGAAYVPGATVTQTLALIQDYDNYKNIYPEVIESALMERQGNDFRIYLRLLKKKIITVVLDTNHDVHYIELDGGRWFCRSHTTRVSEVDHAGHAEEKVQAPDVGYGFLWRLYSYWRFQDRDGGVDMECRAISLSRDIPPGLGWVLEPLARSLPREALVNTLEATRQALEVLQIR
jgi:hypothetical protein